VANDALKQYRTAENSGTNMDVCVQEGFVAAAYLQANNQDRYAEWVSRKEYDCERAGIRRS
jgi:hypothetical protein